MEERKYNKEERFDAKAIEGLKHHYTEILRLLGEDPAREGLQKTPERVAKAMSFLTKGYDENPLEIIRSATFREEYKQMGAGEGHRTLFALRAPYAAVLRQGACRLHPQRPYHGASKIAVWWSASPAACRYRKG